MVVPARRVRVYRDRRAASDAAPWQERRVYCWTIEQCDPETRAACHAHIVQENCWDFWVMRGAKYKGCCKKADDCRDCCIIQRKFSEELAVYVRVAEERPAPSPSQVNARGSCQHLQAKGQLPDGAALRRLLRDRSLEEIGDFRCRRRGVHLDQGYVSDICANASRECVFLH